MTHLEESHRRLARDVHAVLADVDELLKAVTPEKGEMTLKARARFDAALRRARIRIAEMEAVTKARTRRAVGETDLYAHRHPWRTAGVAAATGVAVGAIVGFLSARH